MGGDGTLSREEVQAVHERMFDTADVDGAVTMEEMRVMMDGASNRLSSARCRAVDTAGRMRPAAGAAQSGAVTCMIEPFSKSVRNTIEPSASTSTSRTRPWLRSRRSSSTT